ncbi:hypothetical protein IJ135_02195 [Candidatus Saccharibacteria bacterium]|nr:hypothetical protein [Candidatus Saccharibacteria bacterium]
MGDIYLTAELDDAMFSGNQVIARKPVELEDVQAMLEAGWIISRLDSSMSAVLEVLKNKHEIDIAAMENPPAVRLGLRDAVMVLSVHGLALDGRQAYTAEEIASARFKFAVYTVMSVA